MWPRHKSTDLNKILTYIGFESEILVHHNAAAKGLASDMSESMKSPSVFFIKFKDALKAGVA